MEDGGGGATKNFLQIQSTKCPEKRPGSVLQSGVYKELKKKQALCNKFFHETCPETRPESVLLSGVYKETPIRRINL